MLRRHFHAGGQLCFAMMRDDLPLPLLPATPIRCMLADASILISEPDTYDSIISGVAGRRYATH